MAICAYLILQVLNEQRATDYREKMATGFFHLIALGVARQPAGPARDAWLARLAGKLNGSGLGRAQYRLRVQEATADHPAALVIERDQHGLTATQILPAGFIGGPEFKPNESFSFQVSTANQEETDRYWNAIVNNGGQESQCGWCKDKWGFSWQITPVQLTKAVSDSDPAVAQRAFKAMMGMQKIDIAQIEAACCAS